MDLVYCSLEVRDKVFLACAWSAVDADDGVYWVGLSGVAVDLDDVDGGVWYFDICYCRNVEVGVSVYCDIWSVVCSAVWYWE